MNIPDRTAAMKTISKIDTKERMIDAVNGKMQRLSAHIE